MKLGEYFKHIKHNSILIKLIGNDSMHTLYIGSIGTFSNWVHKNEYYDLEIITISFDEFKQMCIYLDGE